MFSGTDLQRLMDAVSKLASNPLVRILILIASISSLFVLGVMAELGLMYVPIVNKSSLFSTIALYTTIILASLIMIRYAVQSVWMATYGLRLSSEWSPRKSKLVRYAIFIAFWILTALIMSLGSLALGEYSTGASIKLIYYFIIKIISLDSSRLLIVLFLYYVFFTFLHVRLSRRLQERLAEIAAIIETAPHPSETTTQELESLAKPVEERARYLLVSISLFRYLIACIILTFIGGIFVEYHRDVEYAVNLRARDLSADPVEATIIVPAIGGVLAFTEQNERAVYFSWNSIQSIEPR